MGFVQEYTQEDIAELFDDKDWHNEYFTTWCPFDSHAKKALCVYPDGRYFCLSCQQGGTLKYLYNYVAKDKKHHNPSIIRRQSNDVVPAWRSWLAQYDMWEGFVAQAQENLRVFPFIGKYIYDRGISKATIDTAGLGVIDSWIVFPCYDQEHKLVDLTVRNIETKYYAIRPRQKDEGVHAFCPNWKRVLEHNTVLIPYGIFDCLSLYDAGYATLTGISGKQFDFALLESLNKKFIVIPDYNEYMGAWNLVRALGWRGTIKDIPWMNYDGCKDINDIHRKFGLDKLKSLITI